MPLPRGTAWTAWPRYGSGEVCGHSSRGIYMLMFQTRRYQNIIPVVWSCIGDWAGAERLMHRGLVKGFRLL